MPLITFSNVTKKYDSKIVIDNVNFSIERSNITVLMGPNGAGKSTIAKLLIGTEKPTSGDITRKKNIKISYLPQGFKPKKEIPIRAIDYLECMNLETVNLIGSVYDSQDSIDKILYKDMNQMSGGELQTFLLAVIFAQKPDLLILDEPTAYLDFDREKKFYKMLETERDKKKMSIFIISHDLHSVINSSDKVLCLNHHICCEGLPNIDISSDANISIYEHKHDHNH
jgi:zinc transport system ATP-binding protein